MIGEIAIRRVLVPSAAIVAASIGFVAAADATGLSLTLPQSTAFSYLGHSCGGIQEKAYAIGFDAFSGNPVGDVYISTHCGGSGHSSPGTTYSAWVAVTWDFGGGVVSSSVLASAPTVDPTLVVSNGAGATLTNSLDHAYLDVALPVMPPFVVASQVGGQVEIDWKPGVQAVNEVTSSTITATPLPSGTPVVAVVNGSATSALLALVAQTTYQITVFNTDAGGSGPQSAPITFTTASLSTPPPAPGGVQAWWTGQLPPGPSLGVRWTAPDVGANPIDSYEVLVVWLDGDNPGGSYDQTVSGQTLSAYFAVDNTSDWSIRVRAHDAGGWGAWSPATVIGGV